jgi:2-oxoglutarate ferredoxin oxidoreductase subunit delta
VKPKQKPKAQRGYITILEARCKGCDLCIPACPVEIIEKAGPEKVNWMGWIPVQVTEMRDCTACNLCAMVCPDQAIEVYRFERPIPHEELT